MCIGPRPDHKIHFWAYDFVTEETHRGRPLKPLTLVDEYTPECLAILLQRRITSHEVRMSPARLFLWYGVPEHIRSDNGP